MNNNWRPITEFLNGYTPSERYRPEYMIDAHGVVWVRGAAELGAPGKPCARLPKEARPEKTTSYADWWGGDKENYHEWTVDPDGYVTIIQITKYELLRHYKESFR